MLACLARFLVCSFIFAMGVNAQTPAAPEKVQVVPDQVLKSSQAAGEAWLKLVDQGNYGQSWDAGALTFELTITKQEWEKALTAMRQPLGSVMSRELLEQRIAENPKGLPKGSYMVLFYKTSFSNRPEANELLTLQQQNNGQWKVLTYHVR